MSSHSIANRSTFHAASSGSHSVKQIAHAGHVDHEKSDVFMTKTGTRTRTEVEGEKSSENPYGLKSENVHDDEIGRKPKIIRIDGEDSDKLSPRSATMLVDKASPQYNHNPRSRSNSQPKMEVDNTEPPS